MIDFTNDWNFKVLGVSERVTEIAIQDLFYWFEMIFKLQKLDVKLPSYRINENSNNSYIIDVDIFKRYDQTILDDENRKIYIRNDYFEDFQKNYYSVECDKFYKYQLDINNTEDREDLTKVLNNIFHYDDFRTGQIEIIMNILNGNNTIGILPTGTGKSLCYQIATFLQPGISIIICPLKSLLKDQMDSMQSRYISNNEKIDSTMNGAQKNVVMNNLKMLKYQMIWIAPERLQSEEFRNVLLEISCSDAVKYAIIDEAHCMSEWGHNFRTSYLQLVRTFKNYLPDVTILGLTATASDRVLKDLKIEFGIDNEKNIITTLDFIRKELEFEVYNCDECDKKKILETLLDELQRNKNVLKLEGEKTNSGIVFSPFAGGKRGCKQLVYDAIKIYPDFKNEISYFVGSNKMSDKEKIKVQNGFKQNSISLLFATKSFGMGIDKPNIRYIIHFGIPDSIEALYQEVGRAGRDGQKSICYIIHAEPKYKDKIEKEILFNPDSLPSEIEKTLGINSKSGSWGRGDIFDQLMLFYRNDYSKEEEKIYEIYKKYIDGKSEFEIFENENDENEKYIYKLALLGIVTDWTISYGPKIIRGKSANLSNIQIRKNIENYIGKYEYGFNLEKLDPVRYKTIVDIMGEEESIYKYIKIICLWYRENILYSRRKAMEQIDEFISSLESGKRCTDEFNAKIYNYFSPTDYNLILKYIFGESADYMSVLNLFFDENGNLISKDKLVAMNESLNRALVTNRPNDITNFFQILIKMFLNDYKSEDGELLKKCLKDIAISQNKMSIYLKILEIAVHLSKEYQEIMSVMLMQIFSSRFELTLNYEYLKSEAVLNRIILINLEKVEKIERSVLYGSKKNE